MIQHRGPISGVAAFGDYVASAGYDNQVILWEKSTKRALARSWHDHLANQCTFSPDGQYLATASSDYTARIWRVPEMRLVSVLADQADDVEMCAFNPKKPLIATASLDRMVRVYDYSGKLVNEFAGHTNYVKSVVWTADGNALISCGDDGSVKRWSIEANRLIEEIDFNGIQTDTVAVSSRGTIFAGNDEGEIVIIGDGGASKLVQAHEAGVKLLVLDSSGAMLVTLSYDRTMRLWAVDGEEMRLLSSTALPADVWPRSCAFSGEHQIVFATFGAKYRTYDYKAESWDEDDVGETFGCNAVLPRADSTYTVGDAGIVWRDGAELSRLGSLCNFLAGTTSSVITGGQLGKLFDAVSGRTIYQHRSPLNCAAAFVRDGVEHVAVGTYTGEVLIFADDGAGVRHVSSARVHNNAIKGIAASGRWLFSVGADASAAWQCRESLEVLHRESRAHRQIVNGCAALEESCFATVSRDLHLRIWGADLSRKEFSTPHTHSIKCVASSSDHRIVATGSYDGTIALFDRDAESWQTVRPTAGGISNVVYDERANCFVAGSYDGQLYRVTL